MAQPEANADRDASLDEKAIELSPFIVSSDRDVGYMAANSLAGSRLNTDLKDTAASISVLTRDFIDDLGAFDISEALVFANNLQLNLDDQGTFGDAPGGNAQVGETAQSYRVRGLSTSRAVNYFGWSLPTDTYSVERIEDSRGPNSILFGLGSAGGVINASTKQAQLRRQFITTSFALGSYDSWRAAIDINQPFKDHEKGAVRLNAVYNDSRGFKHYQVSESKRVHLAGRYLFTPRWQTRLEFEKGEILTNRGRASGTFDSLIPWLNEGRPLFVRTDPNAAFAGLGARLGNNQLRYISNSGQIINMAGQIATRGVRGTQFGPILDQTLADFSINHGGPGQLRPNDFHTYSVFLEGQFGEKTFVEFAYNHQEYDFDAHDPQQAHRLTGDANLNLPGDLGFNPYAGRLYLESQLRRVTRRGETDTGRATIATEFDAGKWGRYRVAALGEYRSDRFRSTTRWEVWEGRPFNVNPEAAANRVVRRTYVTEGNWASYHVHTPNQDGMLANVTDPITGRTLSSGWSASGLNEHPVDEYSGLLGLQASWLDRRLVLGSGYRYDNVTVYNRANKRNPDTNELEVDYDNVTILEESGRTYTLGLVGHVHRNVSLLYNQANNFALSGTNRPFPDGLIGPTPKGKGRDYGVAFELMDGRIYARAVRYTTSTKGEYFSGAAQHQDRSNQILDGLLSAGLISAAQYDARHLFGLNAQSRDRNSEGYEFSLTANPTRNWRLQANYSYTTGAEDNIIPEVVSWWNEAKAFYQTFPQDLPTGVGINTIGSVIAQVDDNIANIRSVEGVGIVGNRKHKVNFFTRYTFSSGILDGAYIGGGYRFQGKMLTGRAADEVTMQYAPSYGEASFLAGYSIRFKNKQQLSFQLNVSNVFDETDPITTRYYRDGDLTEVFRIIVREPRTWRLSTTYRF